MSQLVTISPLSQQNFVYEFKLQLIDSADMRYFWSVGCMTHQETHDQAKLMSFTPPDIWKFPIFLEWYAHSLLGGKIGIFLTVESIGLKRVKRRVCAELLLERKPCSLSVPTMVAKLPTACPVRTTPLGLELSLDLQEHFH